MAEPTPLLKRIAPALTLVLVAPIVAEVLTGATRFSALFVLPIEMCVWGGGALLIREAIRRYQLAWPNMLLLGIALAVAEECLIQQTSLAPLVIQLKGVPYARSYDVNFVYLLWALIYEPTLVILVPVHLVELIFPQQRNAPWLNGWGIAIVGLLFFVGSYLAWFTWTQIARIKVFHLAPYTPPISALLIAVATISVLVFAALGSFRRGQNHGPKSVAVPPTWALGVISAIWTVPLYLLLLLAYGIEPEFPPLLASLGGIAIAAGALLFLPAWARSTHWQSTHAFAVVFGVIFGAMMIGFIGFIWTGGIDLYFKIVIDLVAICLLALLRQKIRRDSGPVLL